MTQNPFSEKLKPKLEDYLRSIGYLAFGVWAVVSIIFPPVAFTSALDVTTRVSWLSVTLIGAIVAVIGSMTRRDLKVELPGIIIMGVGPFFYFISQLYFVIVPGVVADPSQRYALVFYSFATGVLLAPRIAELVKEVRRQKKLNKGVK